MNKLNHIWDFLTDLQNNNSKDWMDENRDRYHQAKSYWLEEVDSVLKRLSKHDPYFEHFQPKETITRINNNRMFHPDRPVYKGRFSCSPSVKTDQITKIFFAVGPEFTMIGGGVYRPDRDALKSIREAIDYDGDGLLDILSDEKLIKLTGGMADDGDKLKTSPNGYDNDHKHVALLRYKSFTCHYAPSKKDLLHGDLISMVEEAYLTITPFVQWLEKALSV